MIHINENEELCAKFDIDKVNHRGLDWGEVIAPTVEVLTIEAPTSFKWGKDPYTLKDYGKVIVAKARLNGYGGHAGLSYRVSDIQQKTFEVGGIRLANLPDFSGRSYGDALLHYLDQEMVVDRWIKLDYGFKFVPEAMGYTVKDFIIHHLKKTWVLSEGDGRNYVTGWDGTNIECFALATKAS